MDEKLCKLFLPIVDKLYNTEPAGEPFRKPVDVIKYGCYDYYLYVKHPIDLSTIKEKLLELKYQGDAWRFIADVQLMFSNAYLFNKKGTPVWEYTNKLIRIWNSELSPIMQRLNYCCGTLHKFGPQLLFCHGTTPDRYCQIPIGAKYKCYQDQYSYCISCFNKIETELIETLPIQNVKKSDFINCANDHWQYESFVKCTQCTRRVHQICDLYQANENEIDTCIQHDKLELEQKSLCQPPEEYRTPPPPPPPPTTTTSQTTNGGEEEEPPPLPTLKTETPQQTQTQAPQQQQHQPTQSSDSSQKSLDDELLQFARDVDDSTNSAPNSPRTTSASITSLNTFEIATSQPVTATKNSVDIIAARLSKANATSRCETVAAAATTTSSQQTVQSGGDNNNISCYSSSSSSNLGSINSNSKFVCNYCYRKKKIGFDLRHRKFSARRLPHTRMSRYIETKVNEYIREHTPSAGEVTIRVLTAYKDTIQVKPELSEYLNRCRQKDPSNQHPNARDYPDEFSYINRAIFAWQEIDGVDVCVFGMHVQEYGEDCPEPNRQVIYLSYLDSVHFFRPKQVRTAVYHEILLSYFKYVKKLGFRRVFIWVCPSRKGDDYIFYRHPTEQKMPTLKRLSDWYVHLLDKGIVAGIVEKHQNIHQYAGSQNWTSVLSIPYLKGDFWPGEFERLLKIMIESQKDYEAKSKRKDNSMTRQIQDISDSGGDYGGRILNHHHHQQQDDMLSLTVYPPQHLEAPPNSRGKIYNNIKNSSHTMKSTDGRASIHSQTPEEDYSNISMNDDYKQYESPLTPDSSRADSEQPLDLSKGSKQSSPDSYFDDDPVCLFESNPKIIGGRNRKRRRSNVSGYTKRRNRGSFSQSVIIQPSNGIRSFRHNSHDHHHQSSSFYEGSGNNRFSSNGPSLRQKSSTQFGKDIVVFESPEEELIKNLEKSLKRQREGFIVARLNDCDCSPHFESQRRKEESIFTCELMKGREPFLQLARLKNYEFSTLRRAKFSSLAMVKHLSQTFKLDPICNECFSFDSSKRHYSCSNCYDYYLCTSCYENTHHQHVMTLMDPTTHPEIDEFLQQCSLTSTTNSISPASSTISNKSFNESNLDISMQSATSTPTLKNNITSTTNPSRNSNINNNRPTMPLSCKKQKNHSYETEEFCTRTEDEENSDLCPFDNGTTKHTLPSQPLPPPSHSANNNSNNSIRSVSNNMPIELDQVLVENFIRHAEISYDVDFDQMKNESRKLLTHYWTCPMKETCHKCKFVVLSCSFMSVLMRSTRMQMMINCNPSEIMPNNNNSSGINLTTAHRCSYQPKDK